MLARVITLRFDSLLDGFNDEPLHDFSKDKAIGYTDNLPLSRRDIRE